MIFNFSEFSKNINKRLKKHKNTEVISEDSMRYDFFASCLKNGISTENIILEYPHPHKAFSKKKVDSLVITTQKYSFSTLSTSILKYQPPFFAVEMKYLKEISSSSPDKTGKIANLMSDFLKISYMPNYRKLIIFITDESMNNYIVNDNGFSIFHTLNINETANISVDMKKNKLIHYKKAFEKNFQSTIQEEAFKKKIKIKKVYYEQLVKMHHLYIFELITS